jgi:hypothetical protein
VVALTTLGFTDEAAEELVLKVAGTEVQANKSAKWSAEDTDLLLSLHAEGVRIPDIALRLKRTRASVHQRLQYIKNAQTH